MKYTITLLALLSLTSIPASSQPRTIRIDNYDININTIGTEERQKGQPLIIFESGLGTPMDNWDRVLGGVSELGPLLTYDRPGIGQSDPDDELPTIRNVSDKLLKILAHLQLEPPYLLVGHSLGGLYVRGFAVYHPEMLAGMVIIDPGDFTETQQNKRDYYDVLGWDDARIDRELADILRKRVQRHEAAPRSIREESEVLEWLRQTDFKEIIDHPLPDIPVHIITGG